MTLSLIGLPECFYVKSNIRPSSGLKPTLYQTIKVRAGAGLHRTQVLGVSAKHWTYTQETSISFLCQSDSECCLFYMALTSLYISQQHKCLVFLKL